MLPIPSVLSLFRKLCARLGGGEWTRNLLHGKYFNEFDAATRQRFFLFLRLYAEYNLYQNKLPEIVYVVNNNTSSETRKYCNVPYSYCYEIIALANNEHAGMQRTIDNGSYC